MVGRTDRRVMVPLARQCLGEKGMRKLVRALRNAHCELPKCELWVYLPFALRLELSGLLRHTQGSWPSH